MAGEWPGTKAWAAKALDDYQQAAMGESGESYSALAESHAELVAALDSMFKLLVNRPNRNMHALAERMEERQRLGTEYLEQNPELGFQLLAEEVIKNALPVLDKARKL